MRHVGGVAHPHAVRHLLRGGQVGHQSARDAEATGDDGADVDRGLADRLDRADDRQHRRHRLGVARRARAATTAVARKSWLSSARRFSSSSDLVGHARVAEVQRGIGEVDHELGGVFRLGQHGSQVAGFISVHMKPCGVSRMYRVRQAMPSATIAETSNEGADEVHRRRDRRHPVGVGVEPHPVGGDAAVVRDDHDKCDRAERAEQRNADHEAEARARLAQDASDEVGADAVEHIDRHGENGKQRTRRDAPSAPAARRA